MAVVGTINISPDVTRRRRVYYINIAFSGNYANSGTSGDLLDFTALVNARKVERPFPHKVPAHLAHLAVMNMPVGYVVTLELGTVITGAVGIRVWQSKDPAAAGGANIPLQELANGAYPADLLASTQLVIQVIEAN